MRATSERGTCYLEATWTEDNLDRRGPLNSHQFLNSGQAFFQSDCLNDLTERRPWEGYVSLSRSSVCREADKACDQECVFQKCPVIMLAVGKVIDPPVGRALIFS